MKRGAGPALARALAWSREVNRRLTAMPKECAPFAAVEGCLAAVRAVADVVAMGTGTPAAVRGEWTRGGLSGYTDAVFAAPQDGKAEALIPAGGRVVFSHPAGPRGSVLAAAGRGRLPEIFARQLCGRIRGHAAQGPAVAFALGEAAGGKRRIR